MLYPQPSKWQYLVVREELSYREMALFHNTKRGKVMLIPAHMQTMRVFPRAELFSRSEEHAIIDQLVWSLTANKEDIVLAENNQPVPFTFTVPTIVDEYWSLEEGDLVQIAKGRGNIGYIKSVNGVTDPEVMKTLPRLSMPSYGHRPLHIDWFPTKATRTTTLMAPIPKGGFCYIEAPGGAGKSVLVQDYAASVLLQTVTDEKLYPIIVFVGERAVDAREYLNLFANLPHARGEFYVADRDNTPDYLVECLKIALNRAMRLVALGYDVVFFSDSLSRMINAVSSSELVDKSAGMISRGINRDAMTLLIRILEGTGDYHLEGGGSLTHIGTVLNDPSGKASEAIWADETALSQTTTRHVVSLHDGSFPQLNMSPKTTRTRKMNYFASAAQMSEFLLVQKLIWANGASPEVASANLHNWIEHPKMGHPFPEWLHQIQDPKQSRMLKDLIIVANELQIRPYELIQKGAEFIADIGKTDVFAIFDPRVNLSEEEIAAGIENKPVPQKLPTPDEKAVEPTYLQKQYLTKITVSHLEKVGKANATGAYQAVWAILIAIKALQEGKQIIVAGKKNYQFPLEIAVTEG